MKKHVVLLIIVAALAVAACTTPPAPAAPTAAPAPVESPAAAVTVQPTVAETGAAPVELEAVALTPDARPTVPAPVAGGDRPLASVPAADRAERFSGPAASFAKAGTVYVATIVTDKGNIVAELYPDTPESLNNFVTLALNGFYDGLTFHRVEENFVIQGGDPAGDGTGGPGYTTPAEINHLHPRGALAWARTGDNVNPERRSSGSQFYITLAETAFLDGAYTVFGYVVEGMDVADKIAIGDKITRIDIAEGTVSKLPTPAPTSTPNPPVAQAGRPLATVPAEQREKMFNAPPAVTIDPAKAYRATMKTAKGDVVIELDARLAPITVNNFVTLANLGFFDGLKIAHVQPDTYLITGSPAANPGSDVGYAIDLESTVSAAKVVTGTLAMYPDPTSGGAKANGSQFFISFLTLEDATTPLNVFGQVVEGMDIVLKLEAGELVESITISEN